MKNTLQRTPLAAFFVVGGLWLHELIQVQSKPWLMLDNAVDQAIPFIPWTIWIYFSFFPFMVWSVLRVENRLLGRCLCSCLFAMAIGWSFILLAPVSFERPNPVSIDGLFYQWVFTFVHEADPSHITFPCLHVAVTWICFAFLRDQPGRNWRIGLVLAITLSTLFTKQHLIVDVIAGLALAWLSVWMTANNFFVFQNRHEGHGGEFTDDLDLQKAINDQPSD